MYYFAYGSNMSKKRLHTRVDSDRYVCIATLSGHRLQFHKQSNDGSAKCDAFETDNDADVVIGVVFEFDECDSENLDSCEGHMKNCTKDRPSHYAKKIVGIIDEKGNSIEAVTYCAEKEFICGGLKPYCWYMEHVLRGAKEFGLPDWYVQKIEKIESVTDKDEGRKNRELAVYGT
jgi:gamma-glutamylcyclotransferase